MKIAYSVKEAQRATGLSRSFLYILMKRGDLAYTKIGTRRVIPTASLASLINGTATQDLKKEPVSRQML